jgi:hypothetical protein
MNRKRESRRSLLRQGTSLSSSQNLKKSLYVGRYELRRIDDHLNSITENDPEFKEARKLKTTVGKLKIKVTRDAAEEKRRVAILAREQYVEKLERELLKQGCDVYSTLSGPDKTTLRMKYVLLSRPTLRGLTSEVSRRRFSLTAISPNGILISASESMAKT